MSSRLPLPEIEIDKLEGLWWERFAEVEQKYCWVQPPTVRRILRGHYLRRIVDISKGSGILEIGCGTGWLGLDLLKAGATKYVGQDFSETQLTLARAAANRFGVVDRATFISSLRKTDTDFDVIILHGILHHMTWKEIEDTISSARMLCQEGGRLIVVEPISAGSMHRARHSGRASRTLGRIALGALSRLGRLAQANSRLGLWRTSENERSVREQIDSRNWGEGPRGPSPKEMPFLDGEIQELVARAGFVVEGSEAVMFVSHLVVQEWLVRSLTYPILARVVIYPVAVVAAWLDKISIYLDAPQYRPSGWVFTMITCRAN